MPIAEPYATAAPREEHFLCNTLFISETMETSTSICQISREKIKRLGLIPGGKDTTFIVGLADT